MENTKYLLVLMFLVGFLAGELVSKVVFYNRGQKDALRGKQKYYIEIVYGNYFKQSIVSMDSTILFYERIPIDTIIVKKSRQQ